MKLTKAELTRMIGESNKRSFNGRLQRLKFLLEHEYQNEVPYNVLAYEYYMEARLCWYCGAYVATIVLTQLSFEEAIRSHYRASKGLGGRLDTGKFLDAAGFAELIAQAQQDGYISTDEALSLNKLRKDYRNPYVHPHDIDAKDKEKPTFFTQSTKIIAPELIARGVEEEARESVLLLISLLPKISIRFWGLE